MTGVGDRLYYLYAGPNGDFGEGIYAAGPRRGSEGKMSDVVREAADLVLDGAVEQENSVPGVVAMATGREGNIYEGAAGKREPGKNQEMTTDTVFAIFSCTKAITGAAVMQLVEEGGSPSPTRRTGLQPLHLYPGL